MNKTAKQLRSFLQDHSKINTSVQFTFSSIHSSILELTFTYMVPTNVKTINNEVISVNDIS